MKTTVKLSAMKAITVQPDGEAVRVDLSTFGVIAITENLDPSAAYVLGRAIVEAAEVAAKVRDSVL